MPGRHGDDGGQRPDRLGEGQPDDVPAVDQAAAAGGRRVVVDRRHVEGQPGQFGRAGDHVTAGHRPGLPRAQFAQPGTACLLGEPVEAPTADECLQAARRERMTGRVEIVGMPGPASLITQRQHGAAPEVQHRPSLLVDGRDPQDREPGGPPAFPGPVLPQRDDPRRGPQRVAEPRDTAEGQAAVEEVRLDVLGDHRRLPDRDIPDQAGRCHRATAGDLVAQLMVEGEREPVPGDGLMRGGQPWREREAGGAAEVLADGQLVKVRALDGRRLHRSRSLSRSSRGEASN